MLGIDGSDDIHKYAMVSFWAEVLIILHDEVDGRVGLESG